MFLIVIYDWNWLLIDWIEENIVERQHYNTTMQFLSMIQLIFIEMRLILAHLL